MSLLRSLTAFTHLVLSGNTPVIDRPFLFGASLVALQKRDGGLRPIAVGCTFCRLAAEGVQQSDSLGPFLFCLVIFPLTQKLHSEFRIFYMYLDDATLGGNEADVCDDFKMIVREAAAVVNHHKSELICADQAGRALLHLAPDLCRVRPNTAILLGSPIGSSVDEALL